MGKAGELGRLRDQGLLPFQAEIVRDFVKQGSAPVWDVASPVGTGKSRLTTVLVKEVMSQDPNARVLVLVPKALGAQWTSRLRTVVAHVMWADRKGILELASTTQDAQPLWSEGTVVVMSIDLAKRPDVSSVLTSMEWALVVADESHLLKGKRADAFWGLLEAGRVKRGLLLTSVPSTGLLPVRLPIERRSYSWDDIKDWDNHPIVVMREPLVRLVTYERSAEELKVLEELAKFAAEASRVLPSLQRQAAMLVRAASSSLYAAERRAWRLGDTLKHVRNMVMHGRSVDMATVGEPDDEVSAENVDLAPKSTLITPKASMVVAGLVERIEGILESFGELPRDSKLGALRHLLNMERSKRRDGMAHICIWAGFTGTTQYLSRVVEGGPVFRLAAAMEFDARADIVERFRAEGGILLTNGPAIEELTLSFVDICIHYDLPVDPRSLEQRLGVFLRYGRETAFESIALRDKAHGLAWEEALFQTLRGRIDSTTG